jgi:hypothetical protein
MKEGLEIQHERGKPIILLTSVPERKKSAILVKGTK